MRPCLSRLIPLLRSNGISRGSRCSECFEGDDSSRIFILSIFKEIQRLVGRYLAQAD
jgi:hypothetical protein